VASLKDFKKLSRSAALRLRIALGRVRPEDAHDYVGTDEVSGGLQLELLKRLGLTPASRVLEVGCGALHAGGHIMSYLGPGNFVGIDPSAWVREKVMQEPRMAALVAEKRPTFLSRDDFDASELGIRFDRVLSHSVLSHAAGWQLEQFLRNVGKVLAPGGRILASLRLAEGNPYGNKGSRDGKDTNHPTWCYPGGVWFTLSTVQKTAEGVGLLAEYHPEFTEFYTRTRPREVHDWFVFSPVSTTARNTAGARG
jgi:cyclopropane fatty-acyl-phospholipid synthase-like methyltransferase